MIDQRDRTLDRSLIAAGAVYLATLALVRGWGGGWKLLIAAGGGYALFKAAALVGTRRHEFLALGWFERVFFAFGWPGFEPEGFRRRNEPRPGPGWLGGVARMLAGVLLLGFAAMNLAWLGNWAPWLALAALVLIFHLGYADLLSTFVRQRGYRAGPLFDRPWASRSLRSFWATRWNLAFVEMDRVLFLPLFRKRWGRLGAVAGVFGLSGVLHELAISYPAGGGWGGPLAYFAIHGIGVLAERTVVPISAWSARIAWVWTAALVVLPLPLLFHAQFRANLVMPFLELIGEGLR